MPVLPSSTARVLRATISTVRVFGHVRIPSVCPKSSIRPHCLSVQIRVTATFGGHGELPSHAACMHCMHQTPHLCKCSCSRYHFAGRDQSSMKPPVLPCPTVCFSGGSDHFAIGSPLPRAMEAKRARSQNDALLVPYRPQ